MGYKINGFGRLSSCEDLKESEQSGVRDVRFRIMRRKIRGGGRGGGREDLEEKDLTVGCGSEIRDDRVWG